MRNARISSLDFGFVTLSKKASALELITNLLGLTDFDRVPVEKEPRRLSLAYPNTGRPSCSYFTDLDASPTEEPPIIPVRCSFRNGDRRPLSAISVSTNIENEYGD